MTVRWIITAVIAALLLIGQTPSVPQTQEDGITQTPAVQVQEKSTPETDEAQSEALTAQEAENIALAHAGLTEVTQLRSAFDRDEKLPHWDVEFRDGDWEYDYEIDSTGAILKWDKEYDPPENVPTAPQTAQTEPVTPSEPAQAETLSAQEAENIALAHAGLAEVTQLRSAFDRDEKLPHWDVEFRDGDWEYEYEIDSTGTILKWDKEYDPPETVPATSDKAELLTAQEAKTAALAHAKLAENQVTGLRAELDLEDGKAVYEVEFTADGWEYSYEIHGETGKILSWDKELDD